MGQDTAANVLKAVGVYATGIFAGSAILINTVDVPALQALGTETCWSWFRFFYPRAKAAQGGLALLGGFSAIAGGALSEKPDVAFIGSGAVMVGMWPYTVFAMFPTNNTIMEKEGYPKVTDEGERAALVSRWNRLHLVRSVAAMGAFGVMVGSLLHGSRR